MNDNTIYFKKKPEPGEGGSVKRLELNGTDGEWIPVTVVSVRVWPGVRYNPVLRASEQINMAKVVVDYQGRNVERPAWWPGLDNDYGL